MEALQRSSIVFRSRYGTLWAARLVNNAPSLFRVARIRSKLRRYRRWAVLASLMTLVAGSPRCACEGVVRVTQARVAGPRALVDNRNLGGKFGQWNGDGFPMLSMQPIGYVRSPYTDTQEIPKGPGAKHEAEGTLEILAELELGLKDIEGFSHLFVIWAFDRSDGYNLVGTPPTDNRPHGVFATRSPRRPNPIGLTVVELLSREGRLLRVRGVDMLDGTPILDIKPYLSNVPVERLRRGWLAEAEARTKSEP